MDIKEMQSFIRTLPMDKDMVKTVKSTKKTVEGILAIEEREFAREKKEYAQEQKEVKRKERDKKRKKADKKPGMLKQILGDKNEQKRAGMDLKSMLLTGGLLAGIGALHLLGTLEKRSVSMSIIHSNLFLRRNLMRVLPS